MKIDSDQKLIYNFSEHGLYYRPDFTKYLEVLTLTIATILLEIDCKTMKLLGVCGFKSLELALKEEIKLPIFSDGEFLVTINDFGYNSGIAYDYFDFFLKVSNIL